MRVVIFCHSLISDWNHGNAHFLRGVTTELIDRGHSVTVLEPADAWSFQNLLADADSDPIEQFRHAYPQLHSIRYELQSLRLEQYLADADLVLVHEWNEPSLVADVGRHRSNYGDYVLLFHDTHHRSVTDPESMSRYDLRHYDGVLAFGNSVADVYRRKGWAEKVWTWHEAADTRIFRPLDRVKTGDLVWIGNWGDDERTAELHEFLVEPVRQLGLRATVHGVRYPDTALAQLSSAGIAYHGWVPNFRVPELFAVNRVTVHVPRRPYATALPGVPTIRVFEALACGIPLVSAPWDDAEHLFTPDQDFLVARSGSEMKHHLRAVLNDVQLASTLVQHGLATIRARHSCAHRTDELLNIVGTLEPGILQQQTAGGVH